MRILLLAAALTALAQPASAQRHAALQPRASWQQCIDGSNGGDAPMMACNEAEYAFQDGRLNRLYTWWMARLAPAQRTRLRAAQRQWLRTRDAKCARESEAWQKGGGTLERLSVSTCALRVLVERVDWLEQYRP